MARERASLARKLSKARIAALRLELQQAKRRRALCRTDRALLRDRLARTERELERDQARVVVIFLRLKDAGVKDVSLD